MADIRKVIEFSKECCSQVDIYSKTLTDTNNSHSDYILGNSFLDIALAKNWSIGNVDEIGNRHYSKEMDCTQSQFLVMVTGDDFRTGDSWDNVSYKTIKLKIAQLEFKVNMHDKLSQDIEGMHGNNEPENIRKIKI
jgi:hypothetical protein